MASSVQFAVIALLSAAGPAAAHAILVDGTPAARATVPPGATAFALHYNSRIDRARSRLTLVGPGGVQTRLPIDDGGTPDRLASHATLAPGGYTLRWQVLATDGHITRGEAPFAVAQ